MRTDLFFAMKTKAERLEREAREMDMDFSALGAFHDSPTAPEGAVRRIAQRFRDMAERLDAMADKAERVRHPYAEAAE